jgi:hypothetical protein
MRDREFDTTASTRLTGLALAMFVAGVGELPPWGRQDFLNQECRPLCPALSGDLTTANAFVKTS